MTRGSAQYITWTNHYSLVLAFWEDKPTLHKGYLMITISIPQYELLDVLKIHSLEYHRVSSDLAQSYKVLDVYCRPLICKTFIQAQF